MEEVMENKIIDLENATDEEIINVYYDIASKIIDENNEDDE